MRRATARAPLRNPLMDLLQAVRHAGSIAGAAKSLGLSYRHVWGELKRWEQALGQALIVWEKGQPARLTGFATREQGLMMAAGNPLRLQSLLYVAHAKVRYVNRSIGTGTRLLMDQCLEGLGLASADLLGYAHEENSHTAVGACIAAGQADAGLGIASAARMHGLDFVSLYPERY